MIFTVQVSNCDSVYYFNNSTQTVFHTSLVKFNCLLISAQEDVKDENADLVDAFKLSGIIKDHR